MARVRLRHILWPILVLATRALGRSEDLFDGFAQGWRQAWMVQELAPRPTRYDVVSEGAEAYLRGTSASSASALWRRLDLEVSGSPRLSWRWRIERSLPGNERERTKSGDDYAARLLVSFDTGPLRRETPALCYVWAAREPVGSLFSNPYAENVMIIVVESGDAKSGEWVEERRDVLMDFRKAFSRIPSAVTGIALIVDTDDTSAMAVADFDDLRVERDP